MARACNDKADWFWIMDDDTVPTETALEKMVNSKVFSFKDTGFLCSHVNWMNGEADERCAPYIGFETDASQGRQPYHRFISNNIISNVLACTFVSMLVSKKAVEKLGFPIKEFFIWWDDIEYSKRISARYQGYYITDSVVVHKSGSGSKQNITGEEKKRLHYYFYGLRNSFFLAKQRGIKGILFFMLIDAPAYLCQALKREKNKLLACKHVISGVLAGLWFNPKIRYPVSCNK
jgi:GT2 family glycosyltransferase